MMPNAAVHARRASAASEGVAWNALLGIAFSRLIINVAFVVDEPYVFLHVALDRVSPIELRILHWHFFLAYGALAFLLRPHYGLQYLALHRSAALEIHKFLGQLSSKRPKYVCVTSSGPLYVGEYALEQRRK